MKNIITSTYVYGNESVPFVRTGNATADLVGKVLIPLTEWLGLWWLLENPETCKDVAILLLLKRIVCAPLVSFVSSPNF